MWEGRDMCGGKGATSISYVRRLAEVERVFLDSVDAQMCLQYASFFSGHGDFARAPSFLFTAKLEFMRFRNGSRSAVVA